MTRYNLTYLALLTVILMPMFNGVGGAVPSYVPPTSLSSPGKIVSVAPIDHGQALLKGIADVQVRIDAERARKALEAQQAAEAAQAEQKAKEAADLAASQVVVRPAVITPVYTPTQSDDYYVNWIIQKESGGNPYAVNPSSGACGLFQRLPCTVTLGDVAGQMANGLAYITARYGSAYNAYVYWLQHGNY